MFFRPVKVKNYFQISNIHMALILIILIDVFWLINIILCFVKICYYYYLLLIIKF